MEEKLAGRVAVVTGAANGIGREIARAFGRHGAAAVIIADLVPGARDGSRPTHELIAEESGAQSLFVKCDVSRSADLDAAVAKAEELGGLDIMANIAGIAAANAVTDLEDEEIDRLIDVNLKGTIYGCRAAARVLVPRSKGAIINVSSIVGFVGTPSGSLYGATKGAIRLLSYALAVELGPVGIRVNVLHPGVIDTYMMRQVGITGLEEPLLAHIPAGRVGAPNEVGEVAAFLASDEASYVNGASVPVDGGLAVAY